MSPIASLRLEIASELIGRQLWYKNTTEWQQESLHVHQRTLTFALKIYDALIKHWPQQMSNILSCQGSKKNELISSRSLQYECFWKDHGAGLQSQLKDVYYKYTLSTFLKACMVTLWTAKSDQKVVLGAEPVMKEGLKQNVSCKCKKTKWVLDWISTLVQWQISCPFEIWISIILPIACYAAKLHGKKLRRKTRSAIASCAYLPVGFVHINGSFGGKYFEQGEEMVKAVTYCKLMSCKR